MTLLDVDRPDHFIDLGLADAVVGDQGADSERALHQSEIRPIDEAIFIY